MAFNLLKSVSNNKPFTSFNSLEVGAYTVTGFTVIDTKFGKRVRVDMGNSLICLPERYTLGMTPEYLEELNNGPMKMIYTGRDPSKQNKYVYIQLF